MPGVVVYRPARTYPERLPSEEIVVAPPPSLPAPQQGFVGWMQYALPAVGGLGSLVFAISYLTTSGNHGNVVLPILMAGTMILSVAGGIVMGVAQRRAIKKQQRAIRDKYVRYLAQQGAKLADIATRQRQVNDRLYPALSHLVEVAAHRETLWERRSADADFLQVRLGSGVVPLCCPVRVDTGSNLLSEHDPDLLAQAHTLVTQYAQLDDAPIPVGLQALGTLAINGNAASTRAMARALLCHIAALHAPDDVRIIAYFPREASDQWSWLKWLPHTRRLVQMKANTARTGEVFSLLADTIDDFEAVLMQQVVPEIERRRKLSEGTRQRVTAQARPHFIVLVDGFAPDGPLGRLPVLDSLLRTAPGLGLTTICLAGDRSAEPPTLQARLELAEMGWITYEETEFGGRRMQGIAPDVADVATCERIARDLAPLTLGEKGAKRDLAQDVPLLGLLRVASADDVDPARTWQPRDRDHMLRVPIGISTDGEPLILDIKEAAEGGMGPHGLIIGATGSGKSELLRTIVTSLAVMHDPDTINFVLADFKGGASFADLAKLPHTAGMITNIENDLTLVDRMRAALFGEQERRQRMLREAGNLDNIQQYAAKRELTPGMEPMPHLLVIVDEFAELLANRPDFLELFVAIGRVGRSLGMHLLLATQRLGEGRIQGLEGHLRYRICLRTFSAAESTAVIHTPDAFYLPSYPGIGYFKVDTTTYTQFKSATISTPYTPGSRASDAAIRIRTFTATGRLVDVAAPASAPDGVAPAAHERTAHNALHTDMDMVIARLAAVDHGQAHATVHQVWLPPLPSRLPLGAIIQRPDSVAQHAAPFGPLCIPLGLLDKPAEQVQEPFIVDFSGAGGHLAVVGAPQSGKSTLLQTLVASFMATHTPRDVQFYCIDLGGGLLRHLESAPHVGAVCGKTDRDKIRRVFRLMRTIIEEREHLFYERRIDGIATYRARRQNGEFADLPFGDVFLVIDNLALLQTEFDQLDAELVDIAATGLTYGVHVIVATNRWAEVRAKLRDNIGTRVELRLNDPAESEFGKAAALPLAAADPGRGIIKGGLQFQVALPYLVATSEQVSNASASSLEAFAQRLRAEWSQPPAPPVLLLPTRVSPDDVREPEGRASGGIPLGLEEFRLSPLAIDLMSGGPHFLVFGDSESGKTTLLRYWMREIERRYSADEVQFAVIDFRRNILEFLEHPHLFAYACTPAMVKDCVDRFKAALEGRMAAGGTPTIEELKNPKRWTGPQYFFFVDDYDTLVTPSGNPLSPLLDAIQQGRDVGFHVVLARKVAGTSRTAFEAVFQRVKESGSPGLIMNGDPQEGALLGTQRASALPPGRGYLVRRNQRTTLVQTVLPESDA